MSVKNKFRVGDKVRWNDYDYWLGFHKEDVGFEDILTVLGYVDGPLVELQSDKRVVIGAYDWRFELVEAKDENGRFDEWFKRGELPPVGTVCEAWHQGANQGIVEVRYSGECMVLWNVSGKHEQCSASENYTFRPIKVPEQIAAEERENVIEDISRVIRGTISDRLAAEYLYELGYRKMEEEREDGAE